jgi:hypothetical protein
VQVAKQKTASDMLFFFFFKKRPQSEWRIGAGSPKVCSSDLRREAVFTDKQPSPSLTSEG